MYQVDKFCLKITQECFVTELHLQPFYFLRQVSLRYWDWQLKFVILLPCLPSLRLYACSPCQLDGWFFFVCLFVFNLKVIFSFVTKNRKFCDITGFSRLIHVYNVTAVCSKFVQYNHELGKCCQFGRSFYSVLFFKNPYDFLGLTKRLLTFYFLSFIIIIFLVIALPFLKKNFFFF